MARQDKLECLPGAGKTTAVVSVSVNILSANFPFCVVPAGGRVAEMESTLMLAENVNVVLPTVVFAPSEFFSELVINCE